MSRPMYVTPDPQSLREAEHREWREQQAASSIVSVTRISREALAREAFWARVDRREQAKARLSPLRLVRR